MPYILPITVSDLQNYLNDTSTDPDVITLFEHAINSATDRVYTYIGRSYPIGVQTAIFWGDGGDSHSLIDNALTLHSWTYRDTEGTLSVGDITKLNLFELGRLIIAHDVTFERGYEHYITYTPIPITTPETITQVILEIAATIYEESKHGRGVLIIESEEQTSGVTEHYKELDERHRKILAAYRRYM